jgi:hypothetical protein
MNTLKSTGRHSRKARRKAGTEFAKLAAKGDWGEWEDIDFKRESIRIGITPINNLVKFYKNNLYTVQVQSKNGIHRALIRRNDETTKVSWMHKQRIKNELFGKESVAVEVFPPESQLVDEANIYWLWILPDTNYPFICKK